MRVLHIDTLYQVVEGGKHPGIALTASQDSNPVGSQEQDMQIRVIVPRSCTRKNEQKTNLNITKLADRY